MNVGSLAPRLRLPAAPRDRGAVLRLLYLLFYASGASWSPFFSVYQRQLGLTGLQIGTVAGIRPALVLLSQPLWGVVADLRGRRRTLLVTMFLASALLLGFVWPGGFWFILGWSLLYALLTNPVSPLIDSLVLDHLDERCGSSFGQFRLWGAVGWALAAYAVGRAISGRDIRLTFVFAASVMGLGWILAWRGTGGQGGRVALGKSWRGVGVLLRNRRLVTFLVLVTLAQVGAASILTFYSIYMTELGAARPLIGLAFTVQGLCELPLYLAAAGIIRRIGSGRTLALAFLVFAARALLYSVIKVPALAVAVETSHGLSFSLLLVSSVDYVNREVPREWRATGQALFQAAYFGAGGLLGNAWAGLLYDQLGVQGMFRVNGWLILAVAIMGLVLLGARKVGTPGRVGTAQETPPPA